MNSLKSIFCLFVVLLTFAGCSETNLVDTNMSVPDNSWTYAKSIRETVKIVNPTQSYQLYFKLRHTADYRYSNLFVLVHLKGDGLNKTTRYQFKLAKADGEWLGKGSGDLFTHNFKLSSDFRFPKIGNYSIEIEQNMRDNPLLGISDVGLTVTKKLD